MIDLDKANSYDRDQLPISMTNQYYEQLHVIVFEMVKARARKDLEGWFTMLDTLICHAAPNIKQEVAKELVKKSEEVMAQVSQYQQAELIAQNNRTQQILAEVIKKRTALFKTLRDLYLNTMYAMNSKGLLIKKMEHRSKELLYGMLGFDISKIPDLENYEYNKDLETLGLTNDELEQDNPFNDLQRIEEKAKLMNKGIQDEKESNTQEPKSQPV